MTTYRIKLSNGAKVEIVASSAAGAIDKALKLNPGVTVVECYSGLKQEDVEILKRIDKAARPSVGFIQHDIPNHQPYIAEFREKHEDKTIPMFDEETIKSESERAKQKRDNA